MSLSDPTKKMSKSDPTGAILMTDDADTIARKFRRAVTDSETSVVYDPVAKPGVSNLLTIYSAFTHTTPEVAQNEFVGADYGTLKTRTADAVIAALAPIQAEYNKLLSDKAHLNAVLASGAERAYRMARKTLSKVYRKVGFVPLER